jgi:hypothetical protein
MTNRHTLLLMTCLTLLAFGVRVLSLDTQSMWRDEIDTLCFALDFWEVLERAASPSKTESSLVEPSVSPTSQGQSGAAATTLSSPLNRTHCPPTPGLSRVDPTQGVLPAVRALLTLAGWNGPLYTVAMRPWIGLTGDSPFALRYSALLFGTLAVSLTYVMGRRLLGTPVGLVGALLVTFSPHLVWYSQEAKMYSAILILGLLAIYGLRRAVDQGSDGLGEAKSLGWWVVSVGATTLAIYTHILTALLIPLEVVLGLLWWPRTRRHWRGALIALACLTVPYLPLLAWQARNWLLPAGQATLFTIGRMNVMLEATFDGWAGNFVGEPWATIILAGLGLLALFGAAWVGLMGPEKETGERDDDQPAHTWRDILALLAWMFVPLVGIWLISARQPIFTNRYLIWAAPAFYLLVAAGCVAFTRLGRGGSLLAGALLVLVLAGDGRALLHQATQPIKPDFKSAAAYLEERYQNGDLIVFHLSYMENNFDYYYTGEFDGWGAPAPAGGMSEADVDAHMRANTNSHGNVWLVLSEAEMWDPQGLVKAWMDGHAAAPPEERVFAHVSVYRYQLDK